MFSIQDLEKRTDLSRRSIRYYVERGLIDHPHGKGRGAYYTQEHLERLLMIKDMTDRGMTFAAVKYSLEKLSDSISDGTPGEESSVGVYSPSVGFHVRHTEQDEEGSGAGLWTRYHVSEGLELHIRPGNLTPEELHEAEDKLKEILERHRIPRQRDLFTGT